MEPSAASKPPLPPLSGIVVRLLAFDLLSFSAHPHLPGTFLRRGRPIRNVEVVGVVVSVDRKDSHLLFKLNYTGIRLNPLFNVHVRVSDPEAAGRKNLAVDDGTGCVPCILWTNHKTSAYFSHLKDAERQWQAGIAEVQVRKVQLGRLLRVHGKISCFRNQLQVTILSLVDEKDPNAEVLQWTQCMQLALRCYDRPFSHA